MKKQGAIYTDVDGTLIFIEEMHGIQKLQDLDADLAIAVDLTGKTHHTYRSVTRTTIGYLSTETRQLCNELREKYDIVAVTGAPLSSFQARKIDFCDIVVIETGGGIIENGVRDSKWDAYLNDGLVTLRQFEAKLKAQGWAIDTVDRNVSLRVRQKQNQDRNVNELEKLVLPEDLHMTHNLGHVDFLLKKATKGSAVEYLTKKKGHPLNSTFGIGDDINDIDFLRRTGHAFVLQSGMAEILDEAKKQGWYISKSKYFDGINEILKTIRMH